MIDLKCEWEIAALHGEGPLWVARENALYWVDIGKKQVHRLDLADGSRATRTFDTEVTSLAARRQGGLAGTVRDGFAFIDFENGTWTPVALVEKDAATNRFNDGKVDARGRYWAGSTDNAFASPTASLYRMDADLSVRRIDDGYICTNGPAFSADGKTLYHTETIGGVIFAFDLAEDGSVSNKREFARPEGPGIPDGMTVDNEDCLWVCHFAGSRLTRFSPKGEVLSVLPMPVPNPTSCTFGGADLATLYVTSTPLMLSEADQAKYPLSGSLFSCRPGVKGLPTPLFSG
jgi:D-xylonolactonase